MEKHGAAKSNSQECFKNLQVVRFYDDLAPYWLNFTDRYHTPYIARQTNNTEYSDMN